MCQEHRHLSTNIHKYPQKTVAIIQCHLKSIDIKLTNNKTSPRLHHQTRILCHIFLWLIGISPSLFFSALENLCDVNKKIADDATANCSFVAIINHYQWLMERKEHCASAAISLLDSLKVSSQIIFLTNDLSVAEIKRQQSNESKQLLCNKSPLCEGKLFSILKLSDNQSLLNATSFVLRLLAHFESEASSIRVSKIYANCLQREIKRKICVGNWANKQFGCRTA